MKIGGILNLRFRQTKSAKPYRPKKRDWKRTLLYGLGGFVLFIVLLFAWYAKDLPTPGKLAKLRAAESTRILDRNGLPLYETGEERRTLISKEDIPDNMKDAIIATEDANFYKHGAVDFRGIARAAMADILNLKVSQGGSTITQQFVKNAILTNKKSLSRKIKELILAIEIEQIYSKDEILTMYLNEIPWGGTIYGVEGASQTYFGKSAKEVNLSEAATLAAIVQAPTYYSPYGTHTDKLFVRKDYVLNRMAELGYITQEEAEKAKTEPPSLAKAEFKPKRESIKAPHFVMYVKEKLVDLYGERLVNSGGLKVTTTLDSEKQGWAEDAIKKNEAKFTRYKATNAALVSVDVKTGEIVAMVGGKDYFDIEHGGNVNVTDSARQPGSSFKPIVYATAFKQSRFSPAFTLYDLTTDFNGYTPHDYDGSTRGPVSMRQALSNSLNIPAVKTLALVGLPEALKTAKDLGITTLNQPQRYGLSLVLGGGEVKPIEMAGAFAAFSDSGTYHQPVSILKVEDHKGKVLYEYKKESNRFQAIDPQIAYLISHILDDDGARAMIFGRGNALDFGGFQVAAKTGTTQEFHDAWTVGYSPKYAAAVWVGNNDNTKMASGADGSVVAAPIFHDYMAKLVDKTEFVRPAGIKEVTVEKYSGKLPGGSSTNLVKDIFASWQVPTERDDINVTVKVNKVNGKIATDTTPPELVEERHYINLHNEWGPSWKSYPNWEAPIRAWAQSNSMNLLPPTEKDDSYSSRPEVSITSPGSGATISGLTPITVSTRSQYNISRVTYYIDNYEFTSSSSPPYSATIDTGKYSNGYHEITAKITDENGVSGQSSTNVIIKNEPLVKISNVSVGGITGSSATVSFLTDIAANSKVFYGTVSGSYSYSETSGTSTTSHSATLSGLISSKKYYFKIVAYNSVGQESSALGTFTTL
ncbi:MAG: penicillin-binding protein [Candidatus Berkelbacteria bacterium]|nr:penicillin-binding protein [Candidatus Berkelbacteria bacterium]